MRPLLEKGADIITKDVGYKYTVLHWAAGGGHEAVVRLLLEKGVRRHCDEYIRRDSAA